LICYCGAKLFGTTSGLIAFLANLAILTQVEDEYEVRIMRQPENAYFDEYVKVEGREKHYATERKRYIKAEEGLLFSIEVTLKPVFDFGNFDRVQAQLYFPSQASIVS
jgi:hypothetical protein